MPEPSDLVGPPAPEPEKPKSTEEQLGEARALLAAAVGRLTSQPQPYGGELQAAIERFLTASAPKA
jgi:hypothetical protein